jgi:hypothetical protein
MNTKELISERTKKMVEEGKPDAVFITIYNLNRYISGKRVPSIQAARTISQVVRSKKDIWLDRSCITQRKEAIREYSKKNNSAVQFERGRPQKTRGCGLHSNLCCNNTRIDCCGDSVVIGNG